MPTDMPPPRRRTEVRALLVAAIVAVIFLVLFLFTDFGLRTAPDVSEGGEDPATAAPTGQEPAEPAVSGNTPAGG